MPTNRFARLWSHLIRGSWTIRRCFPEAALDRIESVVAQGEHGHSAELRIAIEHSLRPWDIVRWQLLSRDRAVEVFSDLHVWDTEANNGILVYVLLADHKVEILADRGANTRIDQAVWDHACELMHDSFQAGSYDQGIVDAVRYLNDKLSNEYPPGDHNPNELPNRPAIL